MAQRSEPAVQTFLFGDLSGFTALTEAHGDEQAADLVGGFCVAVRQPSGLTHEGCDAGGGLALPPGRGELMVRAVAVPGSTCRGG